MNEYKKRINGSAYGGDDWSPRQKSHREEIGDIWIDAGVNSEWAPLKSVLLHQPGSEINGIDDPQRYQMLSILDHQLVVEQHNGFSDTLRDLGVQVYYVDPSREPSPNLMFCADLVFMTPEGAILCRPASTIRAGEERWVAERLSAIGIPILHTFTNHATFEGADALWINPGTVMVGVGLRTNIAGVQQLKNVLNMMDVQVIPVDLPVGTMHLMGILRFLDKDIALTWPYRIPWKVYRTLRDNGFQILFIPDENEAINNGALNFVTLGPGLVLMADGNPITEGYLEEQGITCKTACVSEILKAAGGMGCLTAILNRVIV